MSVEKEIIRLLKENLNPQRLEVINDSDKHKGHAGDDGSGESHFRVVVVSSAFQGLGRIDRQRLVFQALGKLMGQLHALSIHAVAPNE